MEAWVGLAGVLVGGLLTGLITWVQQQGQNKESHRQWQRDKVYDAYSNLAHLFYLGDLEKTAEGKTTPETLAEIGRSIWLIALHDPNSEKRGETLKAAMAKALAGEGDGGDIADALLELARTDPVLRLDLRDRRLPEWYATDYQVRTNAPQTGGKSRSDNKAKR
jgi:hypothetical protein